MSTWLETRYGDAAPCSVCGHTGGASASSARKGVAAAVSFKTGARTAVQILQLQADKARLMDQVEHLAGHTISMGDIDRSFAGLCVEARAATARHERTGAVVDSTGQLLLALGTITRLASSSFCRVRPHQRRTASGATPRSSRLGAGQRNRGVRFRPGRLRAPLTRFTSSGRATCAQGAKAEGRLGDEAKRAKAAVAAVRALRSERNALAARLKSSEEQRDAAQAQLGSVEWMRKTQRALLTLESLLGGRVVQGAWPPPSITAIHHRPALQARAVGSAEPTASDLCV